MGSDLRGGCTGDIRHAGGGIEEVDKEDEMKGKVRVIFRFDEPFRVFFHEKPFCRVLWDLQIGWVQIYYGFDWKED
jgi:hypothetical protein